jgi:hypothetical protein
MLQLQSESRECTRKLRSVRFKLAQCVRDQAQAPQYYRSLRDSHRIASEPRKARQLTGECSRDHGFLRSQECAPRSDASRAARLFQRHTTCQRVSCQWSPFFQTMYFSGTVMGSKWGASRSRQPHTSSRPLSCGPIGLRSSPLFSLIQASPLGSPISVSMEILARTFQL